jgi:Uma2 family endonuclease
MARMVPAKPKKTVEDYLALPREGHGIELIQGEFVLSPSPSVRHQRILRKPVAAFEEYVRRTNSGEHFLCPLDVILAGDVVVQPDLV